MVRTPIVQSLTAIEALVGGVIDMVVGRQAWDPGLDDPAETGGPAFQDSWYDRTAADHVFLLTSVEPMPPVVRCGIDWAAWPSGPTFSEHTR